MHPYALGPKRLGVILAFLIGALLTGCAREPHSPIVQKVEQAGSGDLSVSSTQDMQQWLAKHQDLAMQVDEMCNPVREKATVQWGSSTEGRLCNAARQLAFDRWSPAQSDGRKFNPGVK
jgi:hypothetical protein